MLFGPTKYNSVKTKKETRRFIKHRSVRLASVAAGVLVNVLYSPADSGSDAAVIGRAGVRNNPIYAEPIAPEPPRIILENPCQLPHTQTGLEPNRSSDADIYSHNPLIACLGRLGSECWDVGAPNGIDLCLDYKSASVSEFNGKSYIALAITAEGNEFYDYALYVSYAKCRQAVARLNGYANQKLRQLPAAGDLSRNDQIKVAGWTTNCLTQAQQADMLQPTAG